MAAVFSSGKWSMYKNYSWRDTDKQQMVSWRKVPAAVRREAGWTEAKMKAALSKARKKSGVAKKKKATERRASKTTRKTMTPKKTTARKTTARKSSAKAAPRKRKASDVPEGWDEDVHITFSLMFG